MPDDLAKAIQSAMGSGKDSKEMEFRKWYEGVAKKTGAPADPDSPDAKYNYRAIFESGAAPTADGKFPDQFLKSSVRGNQKGGVDLDRTQKRADDIIEDTVGKSVKQ